MKNVPHMTSDLYYRFEGPLMDSQLSKAARPQKDKTFRSDYTVRDGCLEIINGPNLFNRPLFAPECKSLLTAGDRPAFIFWESNHYQKFEELNWGILNTLGYSYIGFACGGRSKWLHELEHCHTVFHPGWIEYKLSDEAFSGVTAALNVVPHRSGAFYLEFTFAAEPGAEIPEIIWTHGCLSYEGKNCFMSSYDPQSRLIPWRQPELAANDSVTFTGSAAVLRDDTDGANWVCAAAWPQAVECASVDANCQIEVAPAEIFSCPSTGSPMAALRVRAQEAGHGKAQACLALNWGRGASPQPALTADPALWRSAVAEGVAYFEERCDRIAIHTPDEELNTMFRFAAVAADGMWHPPAVNHCAYSWGGLTTIFRIFYGLTCCGDHDRVHSALDFHCALDSDGRLCNLAGSDSERPQASQYESYGSTADMLWHHYLWTGDLALLREWAPVLDALLAYEERALRDADGLYIDHLGFWASDSFEYEFGCAVGSTMVWRMYTVRGKIAEALGEDPSPFFARAEEVRQRLDAKLWNEEAGFYFDTVYTGGEAVPSTTAPDVYHPIEYGLVSGEKARRMLAHMLKRLTSEDGLVRVDDWLPINWSHNVYSPMETANAAVAAYLLDEKDSAYRMLKGTIKGAIYKALVPGAICCHASSTGVTKNGTDFGDGVSLFLRCVTEGLFGIHMDVPHEALTIRPNFPDDWEKAELSLPDIPQLSYARNADGICLRIELARAQHVTLELTQGARVTGVNANGQDAVCKLADGRMTVQLPKASSLCVQISISAQTPNTQCAPRGAAPAEMPDTAEAVPFDLKTAFAGAKPIDLNAYRNMRFEDIWKVYPQVLNWNLSNFGTGWRCEADMDEVNAALGAPLALSPDTVAAVRKCYHTKVKLWNGECLDADLPERLSIRVDQRASTVYLIASGLCSPMSCYLPQVEILLVYDDETLKRQLVSPYEFDFVSQHTSHLPAVHIGWFGTSEDLAAQKAGDMPIDYDPLNCNGVHQLHADIIRLDGKPGMLREIVVTALKNESGMILHGAAFVE